MNNNDNNATKKKVKVHAMLYCLRLGDEKRTAMKYLYFYILLLYFNFKAVL